MARDHRKLRVFHNAHKMALAIYRQTKHFPKDEWFGLRAQLRRAATSIPCNIVEGSARETEREYFNFLNIACGSSAELKYLIDLSRELDLLKESEHSELAAAADRVVAQLIVLARRVKAMILAKNRRKRKAAA